MNKPNHLSFLAKLAKEGNRDALESLIRSIQPEVHKIVLRFLSNPMDADDVTQDILLKVVTRLSQFNGDSELMTWVYRLASNHLLDGYRSYRAHQLNFEQFAQDLTTGLQQTDDLYEDQLLAEVRVGCTLAMLQCLSAELRICYILGEILQLEQQQAVQVLAISKDNYRQRLARARREITDFMQSHCGLVGQNNACRCHKRVTQAEQQGRVNPEQLIYISPVNSAKKFPQVLSKIRQLQDSQRVAAVYRAQEAAGYTEDFILWLREVVEQL